MARIRTVDFLPEIFRTETNKQFLGATLDQLVQNPTFKATQGYIGRRVGPGVNPNDSYVVEPVKTRTDYQLESGVVFLKPNTNTVENAVTYPGLIDGITNKGGDVSRHDRLWASEYYSWDPFVDLDKFINYGQYFWMPSGPDSVDVFSNTIALTDNFTVTRNTVDYTFSGVAGQNPTITLARQGTYTFDVQQTGHKFWIQATPGVSGVLPQTPNQSSREVVGVINNGDDNGIIQFDVPAKSAQNFYYTLADAGSVSFATNLRFDQVNNVSVSELLNNHGGIDGIRDLDGRTIIFLTDAGWSFTGLYDSTGQPYDFTAYDESVEITLNSQKFSVWRINYVYDDPINPYIKLTVERSVSNLSKLLVQYGDKFSNISFYKDASGLFERVPLLTANLDVLYYQDQDNPAMFGLIRLVDNLTNVPLVVNDENIPVVRLVDSNITDNVLTFSTAVNGTLLPGMILSGGGVTSGTYLVSSLGGNAWQLNQTATGQPNAAQIVDIIGSRYYTSPNGVVFSNGLKVQFQGLTVPSSYSGRTYYVEGVGSAITLLPETNFITPETYTESITLPFDSTAYDASPFDESQNAPDNADYITINRASLDQNAWSRSNRWFHIDIINATAKYNGTIPVLDNEYRAKRPILEFIPNLKLFNFGTTALDPINIIDRRETDALSNINGTIGYSVDGYAFIDGTRVIFAADSDSEVRNKIYVVKFIQPTGSGVPIINLQVANPSAPVTLIDQVVLVTSGNTSQGKTFWYDGDNWKPAQQKDKVNQAPLFDIYDSNGYSFDNKEIYSSSSFSGTKLFSYALGQSVADKIINQPLKYLSINNVGDILFDNNLYMDKFNYVKDNVTVEQLVGEGFVRQYFNRTQFDKLIGWKTAYTTGVSRQTFSFTFSGTSLVINVPVNVNSTAVPIKVFVNAVFLTTDNYTYEIKPNKTTVIQFVKPPAIGSLVEISVISDVANASGFYTIPLNLQNNPLNNQVGELTLGTIRNYYNSICQNLRPFKGNINGQNNTRDLGDLVPYGDTIIQNSAPVTWSAMFGNNPQFDLFRALDFSSREYEKYKNLIIETVTKNNFQNMTASAMLDDCMAIINLGKNAMSPFYFSDSVPTGKIFKQTKYTVTPITGNTFDTLFTYTFTAANYKAILVYLNDIQLLGNGIDYTVASDGPRVTLHVPLAMGDIVTFREYDSTVGNFVPSTPTKLGLYPAYKPEIYFDNSYVKPTMVIRGHDGSITAAFGDIRDEVLLEFEKRIYNNLKLVNNPVPLVYEDVVPGVFRSTDYTQAEITTILATSFLTWVGNNKLAFKEQEFNNDNKFTWNYSSCLNKLDNSKLWGNWRAVYNYFYDTDAPNTKPWEMLGITQKPTWWEERYGPAPYTSGNLVLWEDLEAGRVMNPDGSYIVEKYKRPGLVEVIPSDSEGKLLSPFESVVGTYDPQSFRKSYVVGDVGPVEASWRKSSDWPFVVMRLLALTKPAQFFTYFVDRDNYKFDIELDEFVYNGRTRLQQKSLNKIYGHGSATHGYINWIVDYHALQGRDTATELKAFLTAIDVRLCYRMAAFSDKQYIKLFIEKSSPNSLNTSLLLPDESYQILLYKNPPVQNLIYSSVVVQKTENGYAVFGYSTTKPYFEIFNSVATGDLATITVGNSSVQVPTNYTDQVMQIPYGFEFLGINSVSDFLLSYGKLLTARGMIFESSENGYVIDWNQMVKEFLYWSQQGWATGSMINLNPAANILRLNKPGLIAESLNTMSTEDVLLDKNKKPLQSKDYVVERLQNNLTLRALNNNTLSYLSAHFTSFEHIIVLDNTSVFNDLINDPTTGNRQSRLLFVGYTTFDWNGSLDAQGFILNQDNIEQWIPNRTYTKGQIVKYKDAYWSAVKIIPPSEEFDFDFWFKSDYAQIQKGLLSNAATSAEKIRGFYNTKQANLESDANLLSFGLIGFRPRSYMQNLNLDDISQVNLYQQFIGVKGTTQATNIFSSANLGKEAADYEIFENWAVLRAIYGANANRSYYELQLDEANLRGNPSTIEIIEPQQFSLADQTVAINKIWKQSYPITNVNILPTNLPIATDSQLPSAGYVNWDDADIKLFDFTDLGPIVDKIDEILVGTTVWVAKDNAYNWNIYRTNLVIHSIILIRDNLNNTSTLQFEGPHGLTVNQKIIIKNFDVTINRGYVVLAVPSLTTIIIALKLESKNTDDSITTLTGTGLCFVLETMRVQQAADVSNLLNANSLLPGNRAWVDDDGTGRWVVYQKTNPFTNTDGIEPAEKVFNSRFGSSISQGFGGLAMLVGAPGYNSEQGAVYVFSKGGLTGYVETMVLTGDAANSVNHGAAVDTGGNQLGVIGAANSWAKQGYVTIVHRNPNSGSFTQSQLLTEMPYRLYAATGNGATTVYTPTGVTVTDASKVSVVINDVVKIRDVDWTITGSNVVFTTAPAAGAAIKIFNYDEYGYSVSISQDERWLYVGAPSGNRVYVYNRIDVQSQAKEFVGDGETTDFYTADVIFVDNDSTESGIGSQQIGVTVNNLIKFAGVDYTYTDGYVKFVSAPNTADEIRVIRLQSKTFFPTTPTTTFLIEDLYNATDIYSFSVYVNGVLQRPNLDYSFNSETKVVTFILEGKTGTVLVNTESHFKLVTYINGTGLGAIANGRFAHSLSSTTDGQQIVIGASNDTADSKLLAGRVFTVDRSVERFTVTNANQTLYSTLRNFNGPATVKVNATFLIPHSNGNNNGQFSQVNANTVDIGVSLNIGDTIEIDTNTFALMQIIKASSTSADAAFGTVVQQCGTNCSLYIGQPGDSQVLPQAGSVERFVNQTRLFGAITSKNQNATLTPGHTLRIQQVDIAVSTPTSWNSAISWTAGTFVITGSTIYRALQNVPVSTSIDNTSYWRLSSWIELFANDITVAAAPNNIGLVRIPNVQAIASNGYLTLTILNSNAAVPFTQLTVLPGSGTVYNDLGFDPQVFAQNIIAPYDRAYGNFGASLAIGDDSRTLIVGSPNGSTVTVTTFDEGSTFFDSKSLNFFDLKFQSGVVHSFDLLNAAYPSVSNPSKFVFGEQLYDSKVSSLDVFGTAVSYANGILLIGSAGDDLGDSVGNYGRMSQFNNINRLPTWQVEYGQAPVVDINLINSVHMYDHLQNRITQYFDFIDPLQGKILGAARENIDYLCAVDPATYNSGTVNNYGNVWDESYLGKIWWNLSTVSFVNYHQSTLEYATKRWAQVFPGSNIDVYQWIESEVPPSQYQGPGTVFSTTSFVVYSKLNNVGLFASRYLFWVKGIEAVANHAKKTLSAQTIAQYIEDPRGSGIPYVAFVGPSTTAIYNGREYIIAKDTILHVEFDKTPNNDNIHVEYDLIAAGNPNSFLVPGLFRKMLDSFCGVDTLGNKVPDTYLSPADQYGVQFRPRQSFFKDRLLALKNYLERANAIMAKFHVSDSRSFDLLNSAEPEPTVASGAWNKRLLNYNELGYQDLLTVPVGYLYLVASDSTNDGLWTIYQVILGPNGTSKTLTLIRVQNYDTKQYWEYVDWIKPGYDATIQPVSEVATFSDLARLTVAKGASVKVTASSSGKFEIYQFIDGNWTRVVLEDGTIRIKEKIWNYKLGRFGFDLEAFDAQYWDFFPAIETRQIIRSINEEILINEWAVFRNELLLLVFDYVLTEQLAPEWLFKTSLIDVNHKIRNLLPYQIFRTDNQDFVLDYIKEIKPYHVKIKEFNLSYEGLDIYDGTIIDFDCPAYYNSTSQKFESPILDDTVPPKYSNSEPSTAAIWKELPWKQWHDNHKLLVIGATILDQGQGYTVPPQVVVTGDAVRQAKFVARVNTAGKLVELIVTDQGSGYTSTPLLTIQGGNGTNAKAVAVLESQLVRTIKTNIKLDRYNYVSRILDWQPNTNFVEGQLVRFQNLVYSVNQVDDSLELIGSTVFDPSKYTLIDQSTLDAADRVMGLYTPSTNEPGRELAQVMVGIDYPGVQVMAPNFSQNTGFDVGNFDVNLYDNLDYGPEGSPTYSPSILDAIYESAFTDTYLGTRVTDINVDGGAFIDTYSSHAPEELVPGSIFDALDLKVNTRPGSDWLGDGHGFNINSIDLLYTSTASTVSFADVMVNAAAVRVVNLTTQSSLVPNTDYNVNWSTRTVTVLSSGASSFGNILQINVYGIGGGSQLFQESYSGTSVGNSLTIPVITAVPWTTLTTYLQGTYVRFNNNVYRVNSNINSGSSFDVTSYTIVDANSVLEDLLVLVNGEIIQSYTRAPINGYETRILFTNTYDATHRVVVTAFGPTNPQRSWSFPVTEYFTYDGSTSIYNLANSLQGTNAIDMIVERNGKRLRPPESIEYFGDGSSIGPYYLPTKGDIPQGLIADNDVVVYIDDRLQNLAVNYTVSAWDGSSNRYVEFATAPSNNARIKIAVTTMADYIVNNNQLILRVGAAINSVFAVTTWNDTAEQRLLTQVFRGPTETSTTTGDPYDSTGFDEGSVSGDPGSFDYTVDTVTLSNNFDTGRVITNSSRLWVTMNGNRLQAGEEYTTSGSVVTIGGSIIGSTDVLVITSMTQSTVPEATSFRIFQDMRGNQRLYRITLNNSTVLTQPLGIADDIIHVLNVNDLSQPNPAVNIFGQLTINGERITYRNRNITNNTVSGLRRGTTGTAVAAHGQGSVAIDIGFGELLPQQYQMQIGRSVHDANGSTTTYTTDIGFNDDIDVYIGGSVRCFLGTNVGTLVELPQADFTIIGLSPIAVRLNSVPVAGLVFRITYTPTVGSASSLTVPTTGSTNQWTTSFAAEDLALQLETTYNLTSLDPVTVVFNTPVPVRRVVKINDFNSGSLFIAQSDVATATFVTTLEVTSPVQVKVGGTPVVGSQYSVSSVNPVIVTFDTAPDDGLEIEIYINQAQVLYAQGVNTASNGLPLQEQSTLAARFIEGGV